MLYNYIKFIIVYFYLLCRHSIRRCAGHVIKSRRRASHSPPRRSKNIYGRRLSRWLPAAIIGPAPTLSFRVGPPIVGRCAIFSHGLELLTMARVAPITEFLRTKKFPLLTHWPGKGISLPRDDASPANKLRVGGDKQMGLETLPKGESEKHFRHDRRLCK